MKSNQQISGMYDYIPFLEQKSVSLSGTKDRLSYIADNCLVAENDVESGLGDFGVRKYNGGRFLSSFINLLTLNSYAV